MKKIVLIAMLTLSLLTACGRTVANPAAAENEDESQVITQEKTQEIVVPEITPKHAKQPEAEPPAESEAAPAPVEEAEVLPESEADAPAAEPEPPAAEAPAPAVSAAAPAPAPAAPAPAPAASLSYGGIPFNLAAGTEQWWQIDASDSAYWAVQENINAIRAAAGLGPLSMDSGLSAIASGRCQSFVAGGPFDHSGMATASEICACGPLASASAVCSAWQASPAHYAAMTGNFSSMGVGCWFCSTAEGNYTYWCVTFA